MGSMRSIFGLSFIILASSLCLGFLLFLSFPDVASNNQKSFQSVFWIAFIGLQFLILLIPKKWLSKPKTDIETKKKSIKDIDVPWKLSAMVISGYLGVIVYILGMIYLEPTGFNPFCANYNQIKSIQISPSGIEYIDLLDSSIDLTDKKRIKQIVDALHTAVPISPNHPVAEWKSDLTIKTPNQTIIVEISDTKDPRNGVLIYWWSANMKLNLGTYRCDKMGPILERYAVIENKVNNVNDRLSQLRLK